MEYVINVVKEEFKVGLFVTFLIGLFFIVGAIVVQKSKNTELVENLSISIALGTMSSLVVLDLVPEMLEHLEGVPITWMILLILLGIVILKVLDFFVPDHDHEHSLHHDCSDENLLHIGIVSLIAIILHNLIEGMAVYSLAQESLKTGLLVGLGVGLHNIPMGMIIYTTLEQEPKKKRIVAFLLATLSTFFGGIIMFFIHSYISDFLIGTLICITLGMILYIVLFELIPHVLHGENKKISIIGILIGILILVFSSVLE